MTTLMMQTSKSPVRQRGAALIVGLIFLAMLSLMGVAAYMVANQEERMSGNTRDRIRAFEAAEASLRDCEALLGGFGTLPNFNGANGMHEAPAFGDPQVYETIDWINGSVRVIPQVSGSPAIPDVARQPRCIIERVGEIEVRRLSDARSGPLEVTIETIYRITAMGYGTNPSTAINLQTMFRRQ
jgi:type IV pilus assembly protein PilX